MMRQGINNLENMSDADLERMSKTMGTINKLNNIYLLFNNKINYIKGFGGGLDPKLLRMASQQMKGMSDNDINNLKNNVSLYILLLIFIIFII